MYSVLRTKRRSDTLLRFNQQRQLLEQLPTITYDVSMGYGQKSLFLYTVHDSFFKGGGMKEESFIVTRPFVDQWLFASTMHVLVGIYTCNQFFLPFHSIGVVKNLPSNAILSNPPNFPSSLLKTIPYSPASSTPTR